MVYLHTILGIFIWLFLGYISAILNSYKTKKYKRYYPDWSETRLFMILGSLGLVYNIFHLVILAFEDIEYYLRSTIEKSVNKTAEKIEDKSLFINKKNSKKSSLPVPSFWKR